MPKTILIVDDNAFVRRALCGVFKREADFEVCGEAMVAGSICSKKPPLRASAGWQ